VLGKADAEIFLQRFAEETVRPFFDDDVCVLPRLVLVRLDPNLAIHLKGQKVRTRQLRIVGVLASPRREGVIRKIDVRKEPGVDRVCAGAN